MAAAINSIQRLPAETPIKLELKYVVLTYSSIALLLYLINKMIFYTIKNPTSDNSLSDNMAISAATGLGVYGVYDFLMLSLFKEQYTEKLAFLDILWGTTQFCLNAVIFTKIYNVFKK